MHSSRAHHVRLASLCFTILTSGLIVGLMISCDGKPQGDSASGSDAASAGANDPASVYRTVHASLGSTLLEQIAAGQRPDAELAERRADIDRLEAASRSTTCDFGVDYSRGVETLLPHASQQRELARVLAADAQRQAAMGDKDAAAKRTAAVLRVSSQIGQSARSFVELLTAVAIAQLGCEVVEQSPSLAQAAWKTDIQQAIAEVQRNVIDRGPDVLASEGAMMIEWIRTAPDGAISKLGLKQRTTAERAAAADALVSLVAEAVAAWKESAGSARKAAIQQKAKEAGVQNALPNVGTIRGALEKSSAALAKAQAALAK